MEELKFQGLCNAGRYAQLYYLLRKSAHMTILSLLCLKGRDKYIQTTGKTSRASPAFLLTLWKSQNITAWYIQPGQSYCSYCMVGTLQQVQMAKGNS